MAEGISAGGTRHAGTGSAGQTCWSECRKFPLADEPKILGEKSNWSVTDRSSPFNDSSIVAALEAGLEVYQGKALLIR
ncbi:MAG: hypothetical protein Ct9H300mP21_05840 [Pseudomonadota bacterium]|nr:MAG: hypothetical protein Ct9H300mP21_05840 [Pseudomonadota bacterium]